MKITGGCLTARKMLDTSGAGSAAGAEKVDRIRLYSGSTFEQVQQAQAGQICAVTGLARTYAGQRLGHECGTPELAARLAPSLTYRVILPPDADPPAVLQKLRRLEEEELRLPSSGRKPCRRFTSRSWDGWNWKFCNASLKNDLT